MTKAKARQRAKAKAGQKQKKRHNIDNRITPQGKQIEYHKGTDSFKSLRDTSNTQKFGRAIRGSQRSR